MSRPQPADGRADAGPAADPSQIESWDDQAPVPYTLTPQAEALLDTEPEPEVKP